MSVSPASSSTPSCEAPANQAPLVGGDASPASARAVTIAPSRTRPLNKDAPLLRTEDAHAYAHDFRVLSKELARNDVIGRLLMRDFLDADVEVRRLRSMKVALIERALGRATIAAGFGGNNGREDTLLAAIRDSEVIYKGKRVNMFDLDEDQVAEATPARDDVAASESDAEEPKKPKPRKQSKQERQAMVAGAFLECLEPYERLDQLLGRAVAMRKEALRLLEQQVDRARKLSEEVIDAECIDVPKLSNKEFDMKRES